MAEKAIAEEFTLQQIIQAAITKETSKANADAMQMKSVISINRLEKMEIGEVARNHLGGDRGTDELSEGTDKRA